MSRRSLAALFISAAAFGALIAVIPAGQQRASVDLWLLGVALWAGVGLVRSALGHTPPSVGRLRSPIGLRRPVVEPERSPPTDLMALRGSIQASLYNPRAFARRLRPRLVALAEHRLAVDHGLTLHPDADTGQQTPIGAGGSRVDRLLGPTAGLLDATQPDPEDPPPTTAELADLLRRLEIDRTNHRPRPGDGAP